MLCLIAAEREAAEVIRENLEESGLYPGWRFELCTNAAELAQWAGRPDVLVLSRFLPGKEPLALLKELRYMFPTAHVVLLVGTPSESQRAYIRAASRLGFYNVVTGKLPGDRPYTLFVALRRPKEPELEGYAAVGEEEEPAAPAAAPPPAREEPPVAGAPEREEPLSPEDLAVRVEEATERFYSRRESPSPAGRAAVSSLKQALDEGDLDAVRARLAELLSALEGGRDEGPKEPMERVRPARGVLVLITANTGGVGKTTVAIALGTALARAGVPVVGVDLDFRGPKLAKLLGIQTGSVRGIEALVGRPVRESLLRDIIVRVKSGFDVLPGPQNRSIPPFKDEELARILETLKDMYAVVIADTGAGTWKELQSGLSAVGVAFTMADYVLAVVNQSLQAEEDIQQCAPDLIVAGVTPEKVGIVLNKYSPKLHNPRRVEELFCEGWKKTSKVRPRVVAVIPHAWEEFNLEAYKGSVPGLEDPRFAWHKLAEKIAAMAGYSYRKEQMDGPKRKPLLGIFRRR